MVISTSTGPPKTGFYAGMTGFEGDRAVFGGFAPAAETRLGDGW